ncbi:hypothetical protein HYY75_11570, partial [bacterium]|nr:hypothetical protein [bacterium]
TLSGNPLAVASGIATLSKIKNDKSFYSRLDEYTNKLCFGLSNLAKTRKIPIQINRFGSMFTCFFSETQVVDYKTAKTSDLDRFKKWFQEMLKEGIYLPPSQFEAAFVSCAHGDHDLHITLTAAEKAFSKLLN